MMLYWTPVLEEVFCPTTIDHSQQASFLQSKATEIVHQVRHDCKKLVYTVSTSTKYTDWSESVQHMAQPSIMHTYKALPV